MIPIPPRREIYDELCRRHTKEVQDRLNNAHIAIAGLGGLGSTIAVALARVGVGYLHLIDFDKVELSNLNRQQYVIDNLGQYKTEALKMELHKINPYITITIDTIKITKDKVKKLFEYDTIVCEAFDQPEEKSMLVDAFFEAYANEESKILVSGSGMAGYESSNRILTRKLGDRFYLCGDGISGIKEGYSLMAPRVSICAGHEANMVIRLILGEKMV